MNEILAFTNIDHFYKQVSKKRDNENTLLMVSLSWKGFKSLMVSKMLFSEAGFLNNVLHMRK